MHTVSSPAPRGAPSAVWPLGSLRSTTLGALVALSACSAMDPDDLQPPAASDAGPNPSDSGSALSDGGSLPVDSGSSSGDGGSTPSDGGAAPQVTPSAALCAPVTGGLSLGVVRVHAPTTRLSCSSEALRSLLFGSGPSVRAHLLAVSSGRLEVSGAMLGDVTLSEPLPCRTDGEFDHPMASRMFRQAAAAAGIDLAAYDRSVFVVAEPGCGNRAKNFGHPVEKLAMVFNCSSAATFAHELLHTLYVAHASTPENDYGDSSDVMGGAGVPSGSLPALNGPHLAQLGWLEPERIAEVRSSGRYTLAALGAATPQLQVLVIPGASEATDALFLSFRRRTGLDATIPATFDGRTSVHQFTSTCPAHAPPMPKTMLLGTLDDGQRFVGGELRVTVVQLSHDAETVTVDISIDGL